MFHTSAGPIKSGSSRIFWGLGPYPAVAVAGLGDATATGWCDLEEINGIRENVRIAAASNVTINFSIGKLVFFFYLYWSNYFPDGAKALLGQKITNIDVESLGCAKSAAEGAVLGVFTYQGQKCADKKSPVATVCLAPDVESDCGSQWIEGSVLANAQNWSRT